MHNKSHQYRRLSVRAAVGLLMCLGGPCALAARVDAPTDQAQAPFEDAQTTPQEAPAKNPLRKVTRAKVRDELLPSKPQREVRTLKQD